VGRPPGDSRTLFVRVVLDDAPVARENHLVAGVAGARRRHRPPDLPPPPCPSIRARGAPEQGRPRRALILGWQREVVRQAGVAQGAACVPPLGVSPYWGAPGALEEQVRRREVIPVVAFDDLIGLWSADAMYGPGAQSDDVLVFKPDGHGFLEFSSPETVFAELFHWTIEADYRLRLKGFKILHLPEDNPLRAEEAPSHLDGVFAVRVQDEDTRAGRPMRVLRFFERPWSGFSDHYGFCRRDLSRAEMPDFSWIARRRVEK